MAVRPESWTDCGMDWENPDPMKACYWDALLDAVAERRNAFAYASPTTTNPHAGGNRGSLDMSGRYITSTTYGHYAASNVQRDKIHLTHIRTAIKNLVANFHYTSLYGGSIAFWVNHEKINEDFSQIGSDNQTAPHFFGWGDIGEMEDYLSEPIIPDYWLTSKGQYWEKTNGVYDLDFLRRWLRQSYEIVNLVKWMYYRDRWMLGGFVGPTTGSPTFREGGDTSILTQYQEWATEKANDESLNSSTGGSVRNYVVYTRAGNEEGTRALTAYTPVKLTLQVGHSSAIWGNRSLRNGPPARLLLFGDISTYNGDFHNPTVEERQKVYDSRWETGHPIFMEDPSIVGLPSFSTSTPIGWGSNWGDPGESKKYGGELNNIYGIYQPDFKFKDY